MRRVKNPSMKLIKRIGVDRDGFAICPKCSKDIEFTGILCRKCYCTLGMEERNEIWEFHNLCIDNNVKYVDFLVDKVKVNIPKMSIPI